MGISENIEAICHSCQFAKFDEAGDVHCDPPMGECPIENGLERLVKIQVEVRK